MDSARLARLIDHAERAQAKLVLVGDSARLSEVEAGGLFAAIARRSEEIGLDEVIRHRHQLDREAAKLIRDVTARRRSSTTRARGGSSWPSSQGATNPGAISGGGGIRTHETPCEA
ncbi:MAG TPA: AAA family ATPase [Solirubrobacterales bacterium]